MIGRRRPSGAKPLLEGDTERGGTARRRRRPFEGRRRAGPLRVAVVTGGLSRGGAEKQVLCVVQALKTIGCEVRVYSLERGGAYEERLQAMGVPSVWIGRASFPIVRLAVLTRRLRRFAPDVIQAGHSFVNLYVGLAARLLHTVGLGALRSSLRHCQAANGFWTRWLMKAPDAVLVNSETARRELEQTGWLDKGRISLLPNAIDLAEYEGARPAPRERAAGPCVAIAIGRLVPSKRFDLFLRGLAIARRNGPEVRGLIVGDGPERDRLRDLAAESGLGPDAVDFLGERGDVPALLRRADILVTCSEDEGFPNVILEAMAAGLPVLSTPAGDARLLVQHGRTGILFPRGDAQALAAELAGLARSPERRVELGQSARDHVAGHYGIARVTSRLREIYAAVALRGGFSESLEAIAATLA